MAERNPEIELKTLLSEYRYYNIAAMILAAKEKIFEPLIEIHGERGAFMELRECTFYSRFLKNLSDINLYPFALGLNGILRPHYHVAAAVLAEKKRMGYIRANEGSPDYGETWIENLKYKSLLREYYPKLIESLV